MNLSPETPLDTFQAEAIARGLFAVAQADGMHEREAALVAAFWADTGGNAQSLSELQRRDAITSEELAAALSTPDLRRLFLKTAVLLALADGKVTDREHALLQGYAEHLGLKDEMAGIETQVKEFLLSHLAHVQNTEAVAEVAKELHL